VSPPTRAGPWLRDQGPDDQRAAAGAPSRSTVPEAAGDTAAVTRYLRDLIGRCDGPVPLIDQLREADLGSARGTASIAAAALSVLRSKDPDVIRADLERELAEIDWLARYRVRQAGLDVHGRGSTDWSRIHEVVTARAAYRQRWGVSC
jgi:hypothetical protein